MTRSQPKHKRVATAEEKVLHRENCIKSLARLRYPQLSPEQAHASLQAEGEDVIQSHLDQVSVEFPKLPLMMAFSAMAIQKGLPQPFDSISPETNHYREISGAMMLHLKRKLNAAEKKRAHEAVVKKTPVSVILSQYTKTSPPLKLAKPSPKVSTNSVVGAGLVRKWFPVNSLDLAEPGYCYISNRSKSFQAAWALCRTQAVVLYKVYDHSGQIVGIQVPKSVRSQICNEIDQSKPPKPYKRRVIGDGLVRQWHTDDQLIPAEENYVFLGLEKRAEDIKYARELCANRRIVYYDVFLRPRDHVGIQIPMSIGTEIALRRRTLRCILGMLPAIPHLDAHRILDHAFAKNKNRIGSKVKTLLPERCRLAILAHIRHTHTAYDRYCRDIRISLTAAVNQGICTYDKGTFFEFTKKRARKLVQKDVKRKWEEWSCGEGPSHYSKIAGNKDVTIFYVKRGKMIELEKAGILKAEAYIELSDDEDLQDVKYDLTLKEEAEHDLIELSDDDIMGDDYDDDYGDDHTDENERKGFRQKEYERLQRQGIELEKKIHERTAEMSETATPSPTKQHLQTDFGISKLSISEYPSHPQATSQPASQLVSTDIPSSKNHEFSLLDLDDMPDDLHAALKYPTIHQQQAAAAWIDTHWMHFDTSLMPITSPTLTTTTTSSDDKVHSPSGLSTTPQIFRQLPREPANLLPPATSPSPFAPKIRGFPGMLGHPGAQQPSQGLLELVKAPANPCSDSLGGDEFSDRADGAGLG